MNHSRTYKIINSKDNCAVALKPLTKGVAIALDSSTITLQDDIPQGHKFAIELIENGQDVVKYGSPIGVATKEIEIGTHIHSHNMQTKLDNLLEYCYEPLGQQNSFIHPMNETFMGYARKNGEVGVRNDIFIIPLVGCVNGICRVMADRFTAKYASGLSKDSRAIVLEHPYGCSQLGDDLQSTRKILQNLATHPNAGAVLIVGLGCECNRLEQFLDGLPSFDENRTFSFNAQDVDDEIAYADGIFDKIYHNISKDCRTLQPISKLKIGLKCGGSDGFSGITANPLLGCFSDNFCFHGGTTILTEVPEMFGAEHILMSQAENEGIFHNIVHLINDFKLYYKKNNQPIYENPSPGNKDGGITTLEEKSLGCTQKAGTSKITDVIDYGGRSTKSGLQLLCSPGNDLVALSALAAAGCQIALFTTGRGTPFGGVVPTIKVSTNDNLAEKKKPWIDFNAGVLLHEDMDLQKLTPAFSKYIMQVAEGEYVSHERINQFMLSIWKVGVTL